jgi:Predicted lactoylglutathione lyase
LRLTLVRNSPLLLSHKHRFANPIVADICPEHKTIVMKVNRVWANLAVNDLEKTTAFYTRLGFKPNGPHSKTSDLTSFLVGDDEFVMHFFLADKLKPAMKGELADPKQGNEIIFTLSAETKEEVNQWAKEVQQTGGTLVSEPEEFGAGYYGFVFADPDGHKFNVFYM